MYISQFGIEHDVEYYIILMMDDIYCYVIIFLNQFFIISISYMSYVYQ